ncbi:MAG: N-acetylmuramoyl-L-alanine amidase [Flavisolibacter sp.]|nr:N-acetylmuramoyl-L-alanine amidase [Flavisolibacter sp.]MBD0294734.1 N-acetylmuramoyl-L-alanine amidase [Flavisolibacter sp.]MBD0365119.1 N-acetylmuramoyl-L-alanine amidase [Flavisolibacter sp.]
MLKKTLLLLFIGIITVPLISFTFQKRTPALRTIIIDPGHGGKDPGASGLESTEAQIALEISKKLGKEIERSLPDVKVLFTRTTDVLPGNKDDKSEALRWRANFANSSGADLFISIHLNFIGKQPGGWYEKKIIAYNNKITYVGKGKKRRKVVTKIPVYQPYYVVNETTGTETYIWTAKENAHKEQVVTQGEFSGERDSTIEVPENDPVIKALKLLYAKKFFKNSFQLADLIQKEFEKRGRINRGVKQRNEKGIWVLHATGMPSILVETGFISNKEEEQYLLSNKGQSEIVEDITNALKIYNSNLEKQQTNTSITRAALQPSSNHGPYEFLQMIEEKESEAAK